MVKNMRTLITLALCWTAPMFAMGDCAVVPETGWELSEDRIPNIELLTTQEIQKLDKLSQEELETTIDQLKQQQNIFFAENKDLLNTITKLQNAQLSLENQLLQARQNRQQSDIKNLTREINTLKEQIALLGNVPVQIKKIQAQQTYAYNLLNKKQKYDRSKKVQETPTQQPDKQEKTSDFDFWAWREENKKK